jgi:hypothetical protein
MNFGFNSNVHVGGAVYHVQTEDRGPSHPFLDTVVYLAGRVVYKRSTNYEKLIHGETPKSLAPILHEHLSQQHRDVIAELESGHLLTQERSKAPTALEIDDARDGLDLRLLNPKNWYESGNVSLEIELCEPGSGQQIGGADVQACLEHEKKRIPCAEVRTDAQGCATLRFPMPAKVPGGSSLVVRATDGSRYGELRFKLKSKAAEKTPAAIS